MNIKVSDYIANFLISKGIEYVYEMVGGMSLHLSNSFYKNGKIKVIPMKHEQSASFACVGYSSVTNKPAVAMGISGPGAINMIGGIASSYYDSIPSLFISGQVNQSELKNNKNIRQLGFQEHNIVDMVKGICKKAVIVNCKEELPSLLNELYDLTISGRYGPVLMDIPMNIQREFIDTDLIFNNNIIKTNNFYIEDNVLDNIVELINKSKRPLILAGGGIRKSGAIEIFRKLVHKLQIPVVTSLVGIDSLPTNNSFMFGLIGTYGHREANDALFNSDLLIVLGSRLDIRQTGKNIDALIGNKKIIRVDIDKYELNNNIQSYYNIEANLKDFLHAFYNKIQNIKFNDFNDWISYIKKNKDNNPIELEQSLDGIHPNIFLSKISNICSYDKSYVVDIGQNQIWAAQSLILNDNDLFITSGGYASMGFALPAAIGVYHATKENVIVITGDGGMQCNIQELETISKLSIPIKIFVINNSSLGLIRQSQDENFNSYYGSSVIGYSAPDFCSIANAYKIESINVDSYSLLDNAIFSCLNDTTKPYLINVLIDKNADLLPKVVFGNNINNMYPYKTK
ncbi:thiamine pyrophosphate-binding protein [Brachyspira pilosicoli]|uniref:thiamine pyrophosphate-binding protein n=1 Tax=Brachyspira pilosicoli TaxID=52584 RepID=UPI0012F504D6|nr:thiamine pyrophosphate-binding protein [Brachyspira pilosicoli]MBW5392072.1 thiamine pyrophosphate-binding protein [Brachyspira pilosicoli]